MRGGQAAACAVLGALVLAAGAGGATRSAPVAITGPVTAVGGTTATVSGTVNPGGAPTSWRVEFGTTTSYGSTTASRDAGSGTSGVAVSQSLTGLQPDTTYHYRLLATSVEGTSRGADGLFTTKPPPGVTTGGASGIGPTSAVVAGTVDPNGLETTWWVEYGTSTGYGSRTAERSAGAGATPSAVASALTGLTTGRTYHFRFVARSEAGTTRGGDAAFVTAEEPRPTTKAASSIRATSARLNATVDPNGRSTTAWFEYGKTTAYGSRTPDQSVGSGSSAKSVSAVISGLEPGTTYHFRVIASSDAGASAGADRTLRTLAPPTVVTGAVSVTSATSVSATGTVNPNGRKTTWWFEYGTSTRYGSRTSKRSIGSGTSPLVVQAAIARLAPGQTYHLRLAAESALGRSYGGDVTFRSSSAPGAATGEVTDLGITTARLGGRVNPAGRPTSWWIEYGRTRAYGRRTPARDAGSGTSDVAVSALVKGLAPGRRYHFRVVASSDAGTTAGADASFGTAAYPRDERGRLLRCTIVGSAGPDVLRGTPGRDVICGLGGNDRIAGLGGQDVIHAGPGDDRVDGGAGNDRLYGSRGRDELRGGSGSDRLDGGDGADRLFGGTGSDTVFGRYGDDVLLGGTGRDRLLGGYGADRIFARDGRRDVVDGGPGRDTATFDAGLDRVTSARRTGS